MANIFVNGPVAATQVIGDGETGLVTASGAIFVPAGVGVSMTGTSTLTMNGSIVAGNYAITHLDSGSDVQVVIGSTGNARSVGGETVYLIGQGVVQLINHGSIVSPATITTLTDSPTAAYLRASGGGLTEVINTGTMYGSFAGLYLDTSSQGQVNNSGTISGFHGIYAADRFSNSPSDSAQVIVNSGTITATFGYAYQGGNWVDRLTNSGVIDGYVSLNDGNDRFDSRMGLTFEIVDGGLGEDTLLGGRSDDTLKGAAGEDILSGGAGDDDLSGDLGNDVINGGADEDYILGGAGNDTLNGQAGNDTVNGQAGDDVLRAGGGEGNRLIGGGGNDTLFSGNGDDTLLGSVGNDVFVFARNSGFDEISDFANGADLVNLAAFGITTFGDLAAELTAAGPSAVRLDLAALGGSGSVLIRGLTLATADASDFIL